MFLEVRRAEGLSALSYVLGDGEDAAVIDPQRDCGSYIDIAHRHGARISYIFETHRNEDFVIGSLDLAARTGASIHHGKGLEFGYGQGAEEGTQFKLGDLRLMVLETPGHTDESISVTLYDTAFSADEAVAVFTGDALFVGDVGRTDFYPERAEEVAAKLFDSIHRKLLPLGDQVLVYPAHGAGSVCGSGMASREFTTLGYERKFNPRLQLRRQEFIDYKVAEIHYQPPYFREMEKANQQGRRLEQLPLPEPYGAERLAQAMEAGLLLVDVRSPEAVCGAYIPGSLAIPLPMLSAFAGWYLPYGKTLGLVVHDYGELEPAVRHLLRLGYERVEAFLDEGLHTWEISGRDYDTLPAIHARELQQRIGADASTLLDVRTINEWRQGRLPGALQIYVGELGQMLDRVPRNRPIITFCGSGQRALVAASVLKLNGFDDVAVCLGSMAACRAVGCPIEDGG
jgi:hydroxyacylglutathione hydrolase